MKNKIKFLFICQKYSLKIPIHIYYSFVFPLLTILSFLFIFILFEMCSFSHSNATVSVCFLAKQYFSTLPDPFVIEMLSISSRDTHNLHSTIYNSFFM